MCIHRIHNQMKHFPPHSQITIDCAVALSQHIAKPYPPDCNYDSLEEIGGCYVRVLLQFKVKFCMSPKKVSLSIGNFFYHYCFSQVFQYISFLLFEACVFSNMHRKLFQEKLLEPLNNLVVLLPSLFFSSWFISKQTCFIVLQLTCKAVAQHQKLSVALLALQAIISISCQIILLLSGKKCRLTERQPAADEELCWIPGGQVSQGITMVQRNNRFCPKCRKSIITLPQLLGLSLK